MGLTHCPLNAKLDGLAVTGLSLSVCRHMGLTVFVRPAVAG
jgi:hypothetical protein